MSVIWCGSHTTLAYSIRGRTRVLKHVIWVETGRPFKFRQINALVLLALVVIVCMCLDQFRLLVSSTPRYFSDWTRLIRGCLWSRGKPSDCRSRLVKTRTDEVLGNGLFHRLSHPHRTQVLNESGT